MKRNLLLTIVDGFHYRYLVQTGIFDHLIQHSDKLVVCGTKQVLAMLRERTDPKLVLSLLPMAKATRWTSAHLFLRSCASRRLTETLNIKAEQQKEHFPVRYRLRRWLGALVDVTGLDPARLLEFAWRDGRVDKLLRDHEISLVVLSTPGQKLEDLPYLYAARRQGVRSLSPVYSWDNLTAKGPFVIPPDQLVVWNDVMKREACHYHGYAEKEVFVGGVPVFDPYIEIQSEADDGLRRSFLRDLGLDPDKRLITLTTIPPIYYAASHRQLAKMVIGWMASGQLGQVSLLIRPHPMDSTDYLDLVGPNVVVDSYGSTPNADPRQWRPTDNNTRHLGRTMCFSDVVINIASTITVDAACFDTPSINIAFDIKPSGNDYVGSIDRYYRFTHYRLVVEAGAAAIVRSPDEFLAALQAYLKDGARDREGRSRLVANQVGALDGQASRRTAEAILSSLPSC